MAENENGKWPYRFEVLPINHLFVDEAYQRPLTSFVEKIEKNWNPALVGTLVVSERSKTKFAVVDGQTRMTGGQRAGETALPCLVYEDLTRADEADLFARLQTERRGMVAANRFRAEVIARKPHAMRVEKIVNEEGFTIGLNVPDPFMIQAIGAVEQVYRGMKSRGTKWEPNEDLLRATLRALQGSWPTMPEGAKSGTLIRGMGWFLLNTENVDMDRLTQRLGKLTPSALAQRADQLREGRGVSGKSPAYVAEAIEAQYRRRG